MLDKKVYKDSQLIIRGVSIPLVSNSGNGDLELETFLKKVLGGYKWYLGSGAILYVEQKSFEQVENILRKNGVF